MSSLRQIQQFPPEDVYRLLGSRPEGLHPAEVAERLLEVGPNSVEVRDRFKVLRALLRQFSNFFTLLLLLSAAVCFVAEAVQPGESMNVLGWALLGVALLNAGFSFFQEYRAERAMEALRQYLPQQVEVIRAGGNRRILATELVPGDLLLLREGDRLSADARLVECHQLLVNNAPLTGESKPLALQAGACDRPLADSDNLVLAGCSVLKGSGRALVFATGIRTEFGKLAHLSQAIRRSVSPLERETAHMVRVLTVIAVGMGVSFFLYGVFSGRSMWVNLVFMMGIIVANVPEGLLPTFTLALAMGSLRMAKKNVLITGLSAVEGLGSVHVICTDKTGTLTRNRLSLTRLVAATGEALPPAAERRLLELALIASEVSQGEHGYSGDPLDVALAERLRRTEPAAPLPPVQRPFAFDVEKRRSAGIGQQAGAPVFAVKGAWEALSPMLASVETDRGPVAVDAGLRAQAEATVQQLAAAGLRVIAVAWRPLPAGAVPEGGQEDWEQGLSLAGLLGIEDPLRPEVPAAVATCQRAGIQVIMITGDHPDTALTVAKNSGLVPPEAGLERVLHGAALARLAETELVSALERGVCLFARTTPEQKMKIVAALKTMDLVVAMTGDGVNDAPALKAADVGIAMGQSGTDVARAAAQIILLDDNFASIVAGVEEGRTVFANIRKFTNYVLVSNGPEILPYLLYILLPVPLALTVIQILCIDLGTDIVPSMGLGQEPPDPETMQQPPRPRGQRLLSREVVIHSYLFLGLIEALWSLFLFFLVLQLGGWRYGSELAASDPLYRSATGIALAAILLMQIGNLVGRRFATRSGLDLGLWRNRLLAVGIAIQIVFSWALLYLPMVQRVLGTGPVPWTIYLLAWLGIPLIFGLDWWRKRFFYQRRRPLPASPSSSAHGDD